MCFLYAQNKYCMANTISTTMQDLVRLTKDIKRFAHSVPPPRDKHEELILLIKGYTRSIVGDYWVLYK